tara:strand:- start:65 stop:487 length:423 start_codon:yes stop_codon:yes gene_type:complete
MIYKILYKEIKNIDIIEKILYLYFRESNIKINNVLLYPNNSYKNITASIKYHPNIKNYRAFINKHKCRSSSSSNGLENNIEYSKYIDKFSVKTYQYNIIQDIILLKTIEHFLQLLERRKTFNITDIYRLKANDIELCMLI